MREGRRLVGLIAATAFVLALLTGSAAAAMLYVAPGAPAQDPCSQQSPCSFDYAINAKAQAQDTVVVAPGDYTSAGGLSTPAHLTIAGPISGPLPTINFTGGTTGLVMGNLSRLIDLKLRALQAGQEGVLFRGGGFMERVDVRADTTACGFDDGGSSSPDYSVTIQTSLCDSTNTFGVYGSIISHVGVRVTLHEDTLVGEGAGDGLHVSMGFSGNVTLYDTIAYARHPGAAACSVGLEAPTGSEHLTFTTTNSNYTTSNSGSCETNAANIVTNETAPQTTSPTFVNDVDNAGTADYHEAPSSDTINHGDPELVQDFVDLDGNPHVVDNAVDIGAYEFPSPTVTMLPATKVTATSATLNASVDGHGRDTSNTFTYGRAAVNDNILDAINLPGSSTAQDVNAPISGLQPGTTYLYQLCSVAATAGCGAVASFKTLPLAPVISGSKALAIKQTSAILAGSVNAGNGVTNAHFEFGQTRSYGSSSRLIPLAPKLTTVPVSAVAMTLKPGVLYHARLVAKNLAGTVNGPDFTFTTRGSNAFTIVSKKLSKRGTITLKLMLPSPGRVAVSARTAHAAYGKAQATLKSARTITLLIKPGAKTRRALSGARHVLITIRVTYRPAAAAPRTRKVVLTLRP
jgi:hypothetical protein